MTDIEGAIQEIISKLEYLCLRKNDKVLVLTEALRRVASDD